MNQQNQEQMHFERHRLKLLQEIAIETVNKQMEKILLNYLNSGRAKTVDEATRIACNSHGQEMAVYLQESLRSLGAKDVTVTCP